MFGFLLLYSVFFTCFFYEATFSGGNVLLTAGDGFEDTYSEFVRGPFLWSESTGLGYPVVSNPDNGLWYPIEYLFHRLDNKNWEDAYNFYVVFTFVGAALFFHLFAFELFGRHLPAMVGAFVYALSSPTMVRYQLLHGLNALAWFPLALWGIERYSRTFSVKTLLLFALSLSFIVMSSHIQFAVVVLYAVVLYAFFRGWESKERLRYFTGLTAGIFVSVLLSCIHIFPVAEVIGDYGRHLKNFVETLEHPLRFSDLWNLLVPELSVVTQRLPRTSSLSQSHLREARLFFGIIPLLLSLLGLLESGRLSRRLKAFFILIILFSVASALGDLTPLGRIVFHLPFMNSFRYPGRWLSLAAMGVAALAALGADRILEWKRPSRAFTIVSLTLCLGLPLAFYFQVSVEESWEILKGDNSGYLQVSLLCLFLFPLILTMLPGRTRRAIPSMAVGILLCALVVFDVGRFGVWYKRHAMIDSNRVAGARDLGNRLRPHLANYNRAYDFDRGFFMSELARFTGIDTISQKRTWGDGQLNFYYRALKEDLYSNRRLSAAASLLSLQFVAVPETEQRNLIGKLSHWISRGTWTDSWLFQNPVTPKHATFVPSEPFLKQQAIIEEALPPKGSSAEPNPAMFRKFLEEHERFLEVKDASRAIQKVERYAYRESSKWKVTVSAGQEGYLILSERFHPGWRAEIGGSSLQVKDAFGGLMAVRIPESSTAQSVEWRFLPISFFVGAAISLVAWLSSIVAFFLAPKAVVPRILWTRKLISFSWGWQLARHR